MKMWKIVWISVNNVNFNCNWNSEIAWKIRSVDGWLIGVLRQVNTRYVNLCQSTRGDYWLRRLRIATRNIQKHTVACDTMNTHMQRQTTGMPYLLKDKKCIQQITRPRMGKINASGRATPSLVNGNFNCNWKVLGNCYCNCNWIDLTCYLKS